MDFSKFDQEFDLAGLKADVAKAAEGGSGNYDEVPLGEYEVKIEKMELTTSKKGSPMVTVWFKILAGAFSGQMIFMNQVITKGFQIHIVNEFLRSLESGIDVTFESYAQYDQLIFDIFNSLEAVEFALAYGEKKGFKTFTITDSFEANPL